MNFIAEAADGSLAMGSSRAKEGHRTKPAKFALKFPHGEGWRRLAKVELFWRVFFLQIAMGGSDVNFVLPHRLRHGGRKKVGGDWHR